MRILFIGLASHYTEGMAYQDNMLSEACIQKGAQVTYITDTWKYENGLLVECKEEDRHLKNGVHLIRLEYDKIISRFLSSKIQKVSKLKLLIEKIHPQIIFFHGLVGRELLTVADYVKKNPKTVFYADSHADFNNTARGMAAKLFYCLLQGYYIKKTLPYIKRVFYITEESKIFLETMYKLNNNKMELLPLGGMIISEEKRSAAKQKVQKMLNLSKGTILFMHSGKLNGQKRTLELLQAYSRGGALNSRMIVFGSVDTHIKQRFEEMIETDKRIIFLGWKNSDEISQLLCAADMYCQPGTESATLQMAICCGCAVMIYPHISYLGVPVFKRNGYYVKNIEEMTAAFREIGDNIECLEQMEAASLELGTVYLDYGRQAERILDIGER